MVSDLAGSPIYTLEIAKNSTLIAINNLYTRIYIYLPNSTLTDCWRMPIIASTLFQNKIKNITIACEDENTGINNNFYFVWYYRNLVNKTRYSSRLGIYEPYFDGWINGTNFTGFYEQSSILC